MATMRAKVRVVSVTLRDGGESLEFAPVGADKYPDDGLSEDNTYAKFSPSGKFELYVANPALFGVFKPGQKFYVDFTEAPAEPPK